MPESKWEGMVANLLFVSIITQQKLFSIKTKPFLDYINLSLIANFCYLKIGISPLQCLTSCGGYWKKLTTATRYFTLRKMGEIKQWMDRVTKPCHQAAWKQKKVRKKRKLNCWIWICYLRYLCSLCNLSESVILSQSKLSLKCPSQ